jgi:hypothetical protein
MLKRESTDSLLEQVGVHEFSDRDEQRTVRLHIIQADVSHT